MIIKNEGMSDILYYLLEAGIGVVFKFYKIMQGFQFIFGSECGPGKKSRTRSCTSPKPSGSRPPCPGEDLEESGCEIGPCEGKRLWTIIVMGVIYIDLN